MWRMLAGCVLWALLAPAVADGAPGRVEQARAIALKRSGPVCQGATVPVSRSADVRGLARASYHFAAGQADNRAAYFDCAITFRTGSIRWAEFCHAMVHEYLHLAAWRAVEGRQFVGSDGVEDRQHDRDPKSVMYVRAQRIYPQCRRKPSQAIAGKGQKRPPPTVEGTGEAYDAPLAIGPLVGGVLGKRTSERPVTVLLLHGGGWRSGHPNGMEPQARDLRAHGINARSIPYPLGSVARALEHVRQVAAAEPGPVVLYGISAGGTLAAALAATGDVAGAINVSGPTDFVHWWTPSGLDIKHRLRMSSAEQRAVSPLWRLHGRQTATLLQCGLADPLVDYVSQCQRYVDAARRGNPDTTLQQTVSHGQVLDDHARARAWIRERWP